MVEVSAFSSLQRNLIEGPEIVQRWAVKLPLIKVVTGGLWRNSVKY